MVRPLLIILLLVTAGFAAPELAAQDLISQERWPDGSLRSTRYSEGPRIHFITYHENGQVKEMGCFNNGRRDGVWKQYSDTGALLAQAGFRNGQRQGVWEFRNADDRTIGRLVYVEGSLTKGENYNDVGELTAHRDY
jgi:antitoxin component YwqK of YwqJK toxin-antitoxin module